jgi:GcrA cell cycle regulator
VSDRRQWTQTDLAEIKQLLTTSTSAAIAERYGTNQKTLRSALRRHQISVRSVRRSAQPRRNCYGLKVRRSTEAPAARYGAEALVRLPNTACHWPLGDPAEPGFHFCGAAVERYGRPYCDLHSARAYAPAQP